jgi:hypothetical protein
LCRFAARKLFDVPHEHDLAINVVELIDRIAESFRQLAANCGSRGVSPGSPARR